MNESFRARLDILPAAQRALWPDLRPVQDLGFVLYGGTAIALRLGHRQSADFDFFSSRPVDREALRKALPFLQATTVRQDSRNTFEVATLLDVKVAFYGGLDFGRVRPPERTEDGVLRVASLADLMATKLKVILQRSEAKDYQDIAAMVRAGVSVAAGLAAAEQMFKPAFSPSESLKALVYFEGGDMQRLSAADRRVLIEAARGVRILPRISWEPDLAAAITPSASGRIDPPSPGMRLGI